MENQSQLFKMCCNVLDKMSEDLCVNNLIQFNTTYDNESNYMYKHEQNHLYYVKGWRGTICNDSVIKYHTSFIKKGFRTQLEKEFKFYQGKIKEEVEKNCDSDSIIWYDMYECENGKYNWKREIRSKEDLIKMLKKVYYIEEYGYSIEDFVK